MVRIILAQILAVVLMLQHFITWRFLWAQCTCTANYNYLCLPLFVHTGIKRDSIVTVLQIVLGNPMREFLSSLCCHTSYVIFDAQINLKPLIDIIRSSCPSTCVVWPRINRI